VPASLACPLRGSCKSGVRGHRLRPARRRRRGVGREHGLDHPRHGRSAPAPSVLRYALRSLLERDSPLRIPPAALPGSLRFLASFAAHSTQRRWLAGVQSYAEISAQALDAYGQLAEAGVSAPVTEAPVYLTFGHPEQAAPVQHELDVLPTTGRATRSAN
jgi:hypothetical protein